MHFILINPSCSLLCLCHVVFPEAVVNDISGENKAGAADVSASQHVMVCALKELGSLVQSLSATASPLIQEPSIGETHKILNKSFYKHKMDLLRIEFF